MNAYRPMPYSVIEPTPMSYGGLTDSYNLSSTLSYDSSYLNALRNINNRNLASLNGFNTMSSSQFTSSGYMTNPYQSNNSMPNQRGMMMNNPQYGNQGGYDELDLEFARIEAQTSRDNNPELNSDLYVNRVRNLNNVNRGQNQNYMYQSNPDFSGEQMTNINQQPRLNKKTIKQIQHQQHQQQMQQPKKPGEMDKETLRSILAPRLDPAINKKNQSQQRNQAYSPPITVRNRAAMLPPIESQMQYDLTDFGYLPMTVPQYAAFQPVPVPVPVPIPMYTMDPVAATRHMPYASESYSRLPVPPKTMKSKNNDPYFFERLNKNEQNRSGEEGRRITKKNKLQHTVAPLRNPNVHEYLYLLSKKKPDDVVELGYADKFKDTKRRNEMDKKAHAHVVEGYKKFKESQGLGNDFLGKHNKETNEEKYEKMMKRNTYGNQVRDMNYQKQAEIMMRKNGGMMMPNGPPVAYYYANPVGSVTSLPNIRRLPTNNSTTTYQKTSNVKSKSNA